MIDSVNTCLSRAVHVRNLGSSSSFKPIFRLGFLRGANERAMVVRYLDEHKI